MRLRQVLAVFCIASLQSPAVQAAATDDLDAAIAEIRADTVLLNRWMTDQLKEAVPFNATSGAAVPTQLKIFGIEVGVEAVVSGTKLDVSGFRNLPTSIVDTQTTDLYDRMPFPAILGHAKIGLPFGIDAGIRLGGIPEQTMDSTDTTIKVKNKIIGLDVRKNLVEEGLTHPFGLTVGMNYTHAQGNIHATTPYSAKMDPIVLNSVTYETTLDAVGTDDASWDTNSFGLQAILNKKIAFVNPYIGASANRNWGSISNTLTETGTVTLTEAGNPANTSGESDLTPITSTETRDPKSWHLRALAGIEFSLLPFLKLGLHGEFAGSDYLAGAIGLRAQFR